MAEGANSSPADATPHAPHMSTHGTTNQDHGSSGKGQEHINVNTAPLQTDYGYPISPTARRQPPFVSNMKSRRRSMLELDEYFVGPRDVTRYSKWPLFLQMKGSILPKMVIPIIFVSAWSTGITVLARLRPDIQLGVSSTLLTVTGFVVGLGLSFRSSTAYERYAEGRRYWAQLVLTSQSLGRVFWIHTNERENMKEKDILAKMTAMNLLVAFALALKHRLRFEPYTHYNDITDLVDHLETFARDATLEDGPTIKKSSVIKAVAEYLDISWATSNPRKTVKKAQSPLGNLPLEILSYLGAYVDEIIGAGQLPIGMTQTFAYNGIQGLNDVLTGTDRVLNTPLPIAYQIAFSQITWMYVVLLPFQLLSSLGWVTIPASIFASYIILAIFYIGREIENPFGDDTNDLPMDHYCAEIIQDLEIIASRPKAKRAQWVENNRNKVFFPHSESAFDTWVSRPEDTIRHALKRRIHAGFESKRSQETKRESSDKTMV